MNKWSEDELIENDDEVKRLSRLDTRDIHPRDSESQVR
jgi:hypothetical protein